MNRKEYLFVDGYNIINNWEELRSISLEDLESSRNKLADIMAEYKVCTGIEVIIVFDAHMVKGGCGKVQKYKGIEIVYTREHETADSYIEKTLDRIGRVKRVRVATSDWIEQQVVLGRGGTRISARELKLEIDDNKRVIYRKKEEINTGNDRLMGRLGSDVLEKLKNWED